MIDVGAYVGLFSLKASQLVGRKGMVFAFEPNPKAYALLLDNLRLNHVGNVSPIPLALGDKEGVLFVKEGDFFPSETHLIETGNLGVGVMPLDGFVERVNLRRLDLLKVDVEGMEEKVILGALKTINRFQPALMVEKGETTYTVYKFLLDLDYLAFKLERGKNSPSLPIEVGDYDEVPLYDNLIFLHRSKFHLYNIRLLW